MKLYLLGLVGVVAVVGLVCWLQRPSGPSQVLSMGPKPIPEPHAGVYTAYAGSASCRGCHEPAFKKWQESHHALAERKLEFLRDRPAFDPPQRLRHGTQTSEARYSNRRFELETTGHSGSAEVFGLDRVLGVKPLKQFLVPREGGRYQVTEMAVDTVQGDWFNVFGNDDRKAGEWGHWTGRGMNWNVMCAACHNTRVLKNYQPEADRYTTSMAEMGVGCEACHGPMADHVAWQKPRPQPATGDPTVRRLNKEQMLDACGTCHARRADLTGDFVPGDVFLDRYSLTIPDETDLFHPDGQIRDEDYEFAPFLASRMHAAGVRCWDCHDVHTGKTLTAGDALCMRCHATPVAPAPRIDPGRHSFHKPGGAGDACVDCHMPKTTYMQRHARRDHGFTIPDPLLTKEHGIPNACSRCHADKTLDWGIEWADRWYGKRMERPTRQRARVLSEARAGHRSVLSALLSVAGTDAIPLWRASAVSLLKRWSHEPEVTRALLTATRDTNALVRAMALRSLDVLGPALPAEVEAIAVRLLNDPVRVVRVDAAWALRARLQTNTLAGRELLAMLEVNGDQPTGLLQKGVFHLDRGQPELALPAFQRAVAWDGGSAPLREALAVAWATQGRLADAIQELRTACRLAPRNGDYRLKLALALHEAGQPREADRFLEEAVQVEPEHPRAWYNLGLARSQAGNLAGAIEALLRAERYSPSDPQIPYARATVHARLGQIPEARTAAERALELAPRFQEAQALLNQLPNN